MGASRDTFWPYREGLSERVAAAGAFGLAQIAPRRAHPAASDLVGIYEDAGTRLVGSIERPLVSILNLCIRWGGDRRYPITGLHGNFQ